MTCSLEAPGAEGTWRGASVGGLPSALAPPRLQVGYSIRFEECSGPRTIIK